MLATTVAIVPLTWLLIGWRWPRSVSGHDGLANLLVLLQALAGEKGEWSRLAYRADFLGGMKARDAVGPFPVFSLLARWDFSPTTILDLTTFLLQVVIAFLGARAAYSLATAWAGREGRTGLLLRVAGIWACAFAPVLGWKIGAGHQTLVTGMLPFLAAFALVVAAGSGTASATLTLVAAAALTGGVLFTGHQMVLYGAIFGAPILLGAWWRSAAAHATSCCRPPSSPARHSWPCPGSGECSRTPSAPTRCARCTACASRTATRRPRRLTGSRRSSGRATSCGRAGRRSCTTRSTIRPGRCSCCWPSCRGAGRAHWPSVSAPAPPSPCCSA